MTTTALRGRTCRRCCVRLGFCLTIWKRCFLSNSTIPVSFGGKWCTRQAKSPFATFATPSRVSSKISITCYPKLEGSMRSLKLWGCSRFRPLHQPRQRCQPWMLRVIHRVKGRIVLAFSAKTDLRSRSCRSAHRGARHNRHVRKRPRPRENAEPVVRKAAVHGDF